MNQGFRLLADFWLLLYLILYLLHDMRESLFNSMQGCIPEI
jgi:hypothetical protein